MTGQDFGTDQGKWKRWWENRRRLSRRKMASCQVRSRSRHARRLRPSIAEMGGNWTPDAVRPLNRSPFNDCFKAFFELEGRAWHPRLESSRTRLLAVFFGYQFW